MKNDSVKPEDAFLEEHIAALVGIGLEQPHLQSVVANLGTHRRQSIDAALKEARQEGVRLTRLVLKLERMCVQW